MQSTCRAETMRAGLKRQRSWTTEEEQGGGKQLVTRATADDLWPSVCTSEPDDAGQQRSVGPLPAQATKQPTNHNDKFSFWVPVSDGMTKAVSPFAASQGEASLAEPGEVGSHVMHLW